MQESPTRPICVHFDILVVLKHLAFSSKSPSQYRYTSVDFDVVMCPNPLNTEVPTHPSRVAVVIHHHARLAIFRSLITSLFNLAGALATLHQTMCAIVCDEYDTAGICGLRETHGRQGKMITVQCIGNCSSGDGSRARACFENTTSFYFI